MKNKLAIYKALENVLKQEQLKEGVSLSEYTTFKIGGPADLLVLPHSVEELSKVLAILSEAGSTVTVLGGGSNVLVLDGGIRGVLVCLREMKDRLHVTSEGIVASAGVTMKEASEFAANNGKDGLAFAVGIPGTLGGAIFMNAGAYGGEMSAIVDKVRSVDIQGTIHERSAKECKFGYRHSIFQDNGEIIAEITFQLPLGNTKDILLEMENLTQQRESKQPLEWPSAGSTFKRPEGYYAGTLIEQSGLKGFSVGDAEVSSKHAGFVINKGNATAKDVLRLIEEVQKRVFDAHGVHLEREVRLMGEDI